MLLTNNPQSVSSPASFQINGKAFQISPTPEFTKFPIWVGETDSFRISGQAGRSVMVSMLEFKIEE
jgi:hypothetical protein